MKRTASTNLIACAVIFGAFTVGFASGPALAEPEQDTSFAFHFSYSQEELASVPQAEALLERLERAVRRHCGGPGGISLDDRRLVDACVDATMKDSISKFESPAVAQAYESRAAG